MTTVTASTATPLRRLYVARFGFAIVWAAAFALSASTLNPLSVALLVLYPAVDVAAAVADLRSSGDSSARRPLLANLALSSAATIAVAIAAASGAAAVLGVWAAWAVTAGATQLVVGLRRRRLGGQLPMIASGAISTLAGAGFAAAATRADPSLTGLAGYATLGGIFFLASALRQRG